jgi:hypothetical protein
MSSRFAVTREVLARICAFLLGAGLAFFLLYSRDLATRCSEPRETVTLLDYSTGRCYAVWAAQHEVKWQEVECRGK